MYFSNKIFILESMKKVNFLPFKVTSMVLFPVAIIHVLPTFINQSSIVTSHSLFTICFNINLIIILKSEDVSMLQINSWLGVSIKQVIRDGRCGSLQVLHGFLWSQKNLVFSWQVWKLLLPQLLTIQIVPVMTLC